MKKTFVTAVLTFLIDQLSKYIVVKYFDLETVMFIEIFPPFLNFSMAWNYGINFGLFSSYSSAHRWFLITFAVLVCAGIIYLVRREPTTKFGFICAGLLIGGALGNAFDRLVYGAVADFLNISCCNIDNPFAFNIADIAIFIGAIGLTIFGASKSTT